jgi:outer membrane protein assembly factor BamB
MRARTTPASRLLAALALTFGLAGCGTVGGWFGFGDNVAAKAKPAELVDFKPSATLARAWEAQVGAGKPYVFAPGSDGEAIYAAGKDGRLARIDLTSGREVWRIDAGTPLSAGVGVGAGLVVVASPKGDVLAYRAADGKPAWTTRLPGEILTVPAISEAGVAVRTIDGKITLLDSADGKKKWVTGRTLPSLVLRAPGELLAAGTAIHAGYPGGKLVAYSMRNGAPVWEASVAQARGATEIERIADVTGALVADARMVCGVAYQGRLSCFDIVNGNPIWSREFSGLGGVAQDGGNLYAADDKDVVLAFDKQRGSALWKQAALSGRALATPAPLGRHVAVADAQGVVHLLSSADGALAARASTDGSPVTGRMLALDKGLVVQTANGGVYAFKIQ